LTVIRITGNALLLLIPLDFFTKPPVTEHFSAFYEFILFREGLP